MISKPKNFGINRRRKVALANLERRLAGEPILGRTVAPEGVSRERMEREADTLRKRIKP